MLIPQWWMDCNGAAESAVEVINWRLELRRNMINVACARA